MSTQELLARRTSLIQAARALIEAPGEVTADRLAKYTEAESEIARIDKLIGGASTLAMIEQSAQASSAAIGAQQQVGGFNTFFGGMSPRIVDRSTDRSFTSFGEFLWSVAHSYAGGGTDSRLIQPLAAGPLGGNVSNPADGGFLVQKDFSMRLFGMMHEQGRLLSRVTRIPLSANSDGIKLPVVDETSRADGSRWGGVRAYWVAEAGTVAPTGPKIGQIELGLHKIMALGYQTGELLKDAGVMDAVLMNAFREEMIFATEKAIMWGTGAGQPLGFMLSPSLIQVPKESGQANGSVVTDNIIKMWGRLSVRSKSNAVWFVSHEIEPLLYSLTLGSGAAAALLYQPPGMNASSANSPYGTLFGRPVVTLEHSMQAGYVGDIVLADLSDYLMTNKEEMQEASSMHVQFLTDQMVHRLIYRTDGQPATRKAITPAHGTTTTSPYVALADRHA
jgi:HK97 family phage major capsid protein